MNVFCVIGSVLSSLKMFHTYLFSVCIGKPLQVRSTKYRLHDVINILILLCNLQGSDLVREPNGTACSKRKKKL